MTPAPEGVEEHIVHILVPAIVEGFFPSVDVSASPVHNQVHQEQISAEQDKFERVQQHTVEQIVHVPIPQSQELNMEGVKDIPQERFPQQTGADRERNACSGSGHVSS